MLKKLKNAIVGTGHVIAALASLTWEILGPQPTKNQAVDQLADPHEEIATSTAPEPDHTPLDLSRVTRITVVGDNGIVFEDYALYEDGAELLLQDDGRTLKIVPQESPIADEDFNASLHPEYGLGEDHDEGLYLHERPYQDLNDHH